MITKDTLRIAQTWLTSFDYGLASTHIRCVPGVVCVQMMPTQAMYGGLYVVSEVEQRLRDDVGQVIASDPSTGFVPGQYVLCNWEDGKRIKNFRAGEYIAQTEVRFYGRATSSLGPLEYSVNNSIYSQINMQTYPLEFVLPNTTIPVHKKLSASSYESYIRTLPSDNPVPMTIFGTQSKAQQDVVLDPDSAYRIRVVENNIALHLEITFEIIGDSTKEEISVVDRGLPVRATGRWIIIELKELRDVSEGGIMLLANDHSRDCKATILSMGPFAFRSHSGMFVGDAPKIGDTVLVSATALKDLYVPGMESIKAVKIIHENGIVAILEEN